VACADGLSRGGLDREFTGWLRKDEPVSTLFERYID
jgi:hypothetical protein